MLFDFTPNSESRRLAIHLAGRFPLTRRSHNWSASSLSGTGRYSGGINRRYAFFSYKFIRYSHPTILVMISNPLKSNWSILPRPYLDGCSLDCPQSYCTLRGVKNLLWLLHQFEIIFFVPTLLCIAFKALFELLLVGMCDSALDISFIGSVSEFPQLPCGFIHPASQLCWERIRSHFLSILQDDSYLATIEAIYFFFVEYRKAMNSAHGVLLSSDVVGNKIAWKNES